MKRSITIVGKSVQHAYLIKDIDVDKVIIEKYDVDCRPDIATSWGDNQEQNISSENLDLNDDKKLEVVLKDRVSTITLAAKTSVIKTIAKMGGKIIKDITVDATKKGKKAYLTGIESFKEPVSQK